MKKLSKVWVVVAIVAIIAVAVWAFSGGKKSSRFV